MPDSHTLFEITSRTMQRRFLMRPSKEVNQIILGVIGRAQELYPEVSLYLFVFLSNHCELLASAPGFGSISAFVGFIKSNIARELGGIYDWKEKFWGRRFSAIPVLDEAALHGRVRYILEHGCKENLVSRPGDWPGVNCVAALTEGAPLKGVWYDRTAAYAARREGMELSAEEFAQDYQVKLEVLPGWDELSEAARQQRFGELVHEIERETRERMKQEGIEPLGMENILAVDPHAGPDRPNRSPAPPCHAVGRAVRSWYRRLHCSFVDAYRGASARFRSGELGVEFPVYSFRPPLPYGVAPVLAAPG